MLSILHVLSWIIFIGVCIEAGAILFNIVFSLFINPLWADTFGGMGDLSELLKYDRGYFFVITFLMLIVALLRSVMFYVIIKIFLDKTLSLSQPFNSAVVRFIQQVAYLALGIGLFSGLAVKYAKWLAQKEVVLPDAESLHVAGADVWLFMGVILLVIAHIITRGIEMQTENELTV
ncbi:DUF2975 domain-containing protein [Lacibacter luteus]|nr:DUF2975 domain-containing protein [Lacibacter luteus]